ncbi:S1/P1 nuclease [Wenyingzhuangia sp. IMCC45467]
MNKYILIIFISLHSFANNDWGKTGHRTVGEIASKHLTNQTTKKVKDLLNGRSLAFVSIYADEIRSDDKYDAFVPWHYVNFNGDKKYKEEPINPEGDIVQGIKTCILKIRTDKVSKEDKAFYLKMLVHFIGDLHMPLHAGNKDDKGGNEIKVKWFGAKSNLHRVWDSDMIDNYQMSYTELASNIDIISKAEIDKVGQGSLVSWAHESRILALKVYKEVKDSDYLGYEYMYHNFPVVRKQLEKGGIRLAIILNEIFKENSKWVDSFLENI